MKNKTNKNPVRNRTDGDPESLRVRFEFTHPTATAVSIAGTFNDWRPEATPMLSFGESQWLKELALPPGIYEYCFVVDGEWRPDPLAQETVPNPFGGLNSLLKIGERALKIPRRAHRNRTPFAVAETAETSKTALTL